MRNLLRILAVAVGLILLGAPAFAAETFVPAFDANTHVYLDPLMVNRTPMTPDFERALVGKAREKGLDVYLVIMQRGDEFATMPAANWADVYTNNRLLTAWRYSPGYDESNVELIVYLRDSNSDAGSIFVHSGSSLLSAGIDGTVLSDPQGPVLPNSRQWVRTDPQRAFLEIQQAINVAMGNPPMTFLGLTIGTWVVIIVIVIVLLIVLLAASGSGGGGVFFVDGGDNSSAWSSSGDGGGGDT